MINFQKIDALPPDFERLLAESEEEGFTFVTRLANDWESGANRFSLPNEALFTGRTSDDTLVCIGGINQDPFSESQPIGRLRRFYVRPQFRRSGVGSKLLAHVFSFAQLHYNTIQLRTLNPIADEFYCALGFTRISNESATHQYNFPA